MKNICIVGCGNIGKSHAKNLSKKANLYFYSEPKESAEEFKRIFKGKKVYETFDDVLDSEEIDGLFICSPPEFHKDQIIRGLNAKKSVIVEKPMCVSLEEIAEIEEIYKNTEDIFLMIAENYYYKPSLVKIKSLLQEDYIGKIKEVLVRKTFEQKSAGWRTKYGSLFEGGIHFIALISGILDKSPISVRGHFPEWKKGEPERTSITELRYDDGIYAKLTYSWDTKSLPMGVFQKSRINGEKGHITFESNGIYIYVESKSKTMPYVTNPLDLTGVKAMTEDFLSCLEEKGKIPYSDFYKGKRDLEIVFEAYRTGKTDIIAG